MILRLVRWFGKALERDGFGFTAFFGTAIAAFLVGCMLNCAALNIAKSSYLQMLTNYYRQAVERGHMEVWTGEDGKRVYKWKEPPRESGDRSAN